MEITFGTDNQPRLCVKEDAGRFYWSISHGGHEWAEIPESLYREILAFAAQVRPA